MASLRPFDSKVQEAGGVKTFSVQEIRDAFGAGRLGKNVRDEISRTLSAFGLGHIPAEFPDRQHEQVRLYKKGTMVGDFISGVIEPSESGDEKIKSLVSNKDSETLHQIRQMLS